ncbi:MAG: universal stress protein [Bdellovibrionales bacterium]|nr:universal stress protein [Bdellovibrionales bacterium]
MLVIWAIDAIREPGSLMEHSASVLESWAQRTNLQVEPLYVLSPSQLNHSIGPAFQETAQRALNQIVDQHSAHRPALLKSLLPAQVITERRIRVRAAAEALEKYAKARGATFVALPTHGRRGPARLILGSFAETLLLRSQVPTLTIGPEIHEIRGLEKILFSTDFGSGSKQVFRQVVNFAAQLKSKVWLYHAVPNLMEPLFQSGAYLFSGAWVPARNYFAQEVQECERHGNAWSRWAKNHGVECEFVLDETMGNIPEHLLALIEREKIGLLALASRSGPIASALLGSITRQVVRGASCPVWVLQPSLGSAATQEKPRALAG